jgi:hypothetical protein
MNVDGRFKYKKFVYQFEKNIESETKTANVLIAILMWRNFGKCKQFNIWKVF